MPQIIVKGPTYGSNQPVRLTLNGEAHEFPCNTEVLVTPEELAALQDSDHDIEILDAEAEAPAPATGGDAGGGGDSGSPAADTPQQDGVGFLAPDAPSAPLPAGFLDRSVTDIIKDLGSLSAEQLATAKTAEQATKARVSLLAAIDEAAAKLAA